MKDGTIIGLKKIVVFAWQAVIDNYQRLFLAVIGISFAVAAQIGVSSLAEGSSVRMKIDALSHGFDMITVEVFKDKAVEVDIETWASENPYGITRVWDFSCFDVIIKAQDQKVKVKVYCIDDDFFRIPSIECVYGTTEMTRAGDPINSVVLSEAVSDELFPFNPLGHELMIQNVPFMVTGVVANNMYGSEGQYALFISKSYMHMLFATVPSQFWYIQVDSIDVESIQNTQSSITKYLRGVYHNRLSLDMDAMQQSGDPLTNLSMERSIYNINSMEGALSSYEKNERVIIQTSFGFSLLLLIVGGISICNTLILSVSERMREIGVCKAVGATTSQIFLQYLTETIIISMSALMLGMLLGFLLPPIIGYFMRINPVIRWDWVLISSISSLGISIISGVYPSYKSARVDPIKTISASE